MKAKKYYLTLVVVIGILSVSALGEIELTLPKYEPFLIGRAHPELAGIEQLFVIVVPPDSEPNKDGLVSRELEAKVINKLNEAGIKIMPGIAGNILNIDELRVYIDMLKFADSQVYVFRIQTSLARAVYLAKDSSWSIKADVWKAAPVMQAVPVQHMPAKVTEVVLHQVDRFIESYRAANPQGAQPADANDITAVTVPKRVGSVAKPAVAKYKYVASKNSKVFHIPDCHWAGRIKPENLVGYNSRDEAIKAGKRPCKICKP